MLNIAGDTIENARQASVDIRLSGNCLLLPIKNGAAKRPLLISSDGKLKRKLNIALAKENPDWFAPVLMPELEGEILRLSWETPQDGGAEALRSIQPANECKPPTPLEDQVRPQFHFTAPFGWLNDPNGLVFSDGRWHLFYQRNPCGLEWENMHWGHAESLDLVHWTWLPDAMQPWSFAKGHCFSGSTIVDDVNAAGFGAGALIAFFTDTDCGECLAFSADGGLTFNYYESNPVVRHKGRDPKVFRHEPDGRWIMIVYDEDGSVKSNAIYSSTDLKEWTLESKVAGFYECPELFALPVDGDPNETLWLMFGANNQYLTGRFDGRTFSPCSDMKFKGNYGDCLYAAQTFNSAPDGRRIQIGWAKVDFAGSTFNQMISFPVELSLKKHAGELKLFVNPVEEIASLHGMAQELPRTPLSDKTIETSWALPEFADVDASFSLGGAKSVHMHIAGMEISYDAATASLCCGSCQAPLAPVDDTLKLRILVDRGLLEIFVNGGEAYMPVKRKPNAEARRLPIGFDAEGAGAHLDSLKVFQLSSIWR